jgi:hypothetical protein
MRITSPENTQMKILFSMQRWALLLLPALLACGCSSIHSQAVRSLISKEGEKLALADQAAATLVQTTGKRVEAMSNAVSSLDVSMKQLETAEMVNALIFSANQNIDSKQNTDAHAVAYMIGKLYLTEQAGLQKEVSDQFAQDMTALQQQAVRIQQSWASLTNLNGQIQAFANKSSFASVDADFIAAVAGEIPGASTEVESVLQNSQEVNAALKAALGLVPIKSSGVEQTQAQFSDLINLLERVKASPKANAH